MSGGSGRALKILKIIKNLPSKKDYKGISKTNTFSKKLLSIYNKKLNLSLNQFKQNLYIGYTYKRKNVFSLLES